jgi:hypothetical protein
VEILEYVVIFLIIWFQHQQPMKIRPSIFLFIVIAAVLIALVLWHGEKKPVETPPTASVETNIAKPATTAPGVPVHAIAPLTQIAANATTPTSQPKPLVPTDKVGLLKEILQANDADIVFYGRLEDQSGSAVSGAAVNFGIQYENPNARGVQYGQVVSDGNGFFTISGYRGANLTITPKKVGYALAATGTSFRYSQISSGYFVPDANNPTVIKMWKLQGAEPLVGINKTFKLPYTAAPMNFDLIAGQTVSSGGDLKITVNRPAGVISGRNPQDWNIDIEVVDGGFIETSPEDSATTYIAPENGYQSSGTFSKNNGPDLVDKMFFIQSRNGQVYSKVHLLFGINDTPNGIMYITFSGVANTNGSRNWEATVLQ